MVFSHNLTWSAQDTFCQIQNSPRCSSLFLQVTVQTNVTLPIPLSSHVWRPYHTRLFIKRVQRATKFILGWSSMDYKQHLISLHILPLMMTFELNDIMFFITSSKSCMASTDVHNYVLFHLSSTTSASHHKLT